MSVLLAGVPYAAAILVYWRTIANMFREAEGKPPANWSWRLMSPVMVSGLTPLALLPREGLSSDERSLLVLGPILGAFFMIAGMSILRDNTKFYRMQIHVTAFGRNRMPRWHVIVLLGSAILLASGVINVAVVGA